MTYRAFNTKDEIREFLNELPEGAQFRDEITREQGTVYTVELTEDGEKRFRSQYGPRYSANCWSQDDKVEVIDDRNLYEKVEALTPGTVFQVERGAPWLRTETGIHDLLIAAHYPTSPINKSKEIPVNWRSERYNVTVLFEEEGE